MRISASGLQRINTPPKLCDFLLGVGSDNRGMPALDFRMQCVAYGAVEVISVGALEHNAKVVAVGPILLRAELLFDASVEARVREGVREGDPDIIGTSFANESDCSLNVDPMFAGIAELQEIAGAYALAFEMLPCGNDFLDLEALIHGVEDFL
jgi:hypothetical protein